jgi:hypothetical protein
MIQFVKAFFDGQIGIPLFGLLLETGVFSFSL